MMLPFLAIPPDISIVYDTAAIVRLKGEEEKKRVQLQEALLNGNDEIAVILLQKRAKGPVPAEKLEALFLKAYESSNTTACLKLINRGYDPKTKKNECLEWAYDLDLAKSVLMLIELGAQKELPEYEKAKYLRRAIERSQINAALILIAQIEDINVQDEDNKCSFLHLACKQELVDVAKALVAKGISTTLTDEKERTALDIAKKRNNADLIELLDKA